MKRGGKIFITTASWEPRFLEGAQAVLDENAFSFVVCFWFEEFAERTLAARNAFQTMVTKRGARYLPVALRLFSQELDPGVPAMPSHAASWRTIYRTFRRVIPESSRFVLDISTMPREALWIILDLLTEAKMDGDIIYHQAKAHGEWCACEPERPHIVPKLGGEPSLDGVTKLLIISGYDEDRSEQFISSFEPEETIILFQEGDDNDPEQSNKRHRLRLGSRRESIQMGKIDCYVDDWGFARAREATDAFSPNTNIIMASLGPKTSAVALYRLHRQFAQSSLVYAPCREYNQEYSSGIAATLRLGWVAHEVVAPAEARLLAV